MQKIFYVHVPMGIVALCGFVARRGHRHPAPAHGRPPLRPAQLRRDPPLARPRRRRARHGLDLGQGVVGPVVGLGRADARLVPHRLPALRLTYQPLRFSIEDPERQARYASVFAVTAGAFVPLNFVAVRLAEAVIHPRVFATADGGLPGQDAAHLPRRARRHDAAVRDAVALRDGGQAGVAGRCAPCGAGSAATTRCPAAGAARPPACPSRERQPARQHRLRRRGVPRLPRARADLRRDHGRQARRVQRELEELDELAAGRRPEPEREPVGR